MKINANNQKTLQEELKNFPEYFETYNELFQENLDKTFKVIKGHDVSYDELLTVFEMQEWRFEESVSGDPEDAFKVVDCTNDAVEFFKDRYSEEMVAEIIKYC